MDNETLGDRVEFWLPFIPGSLKNTPHQFTDATAKAKRQLRQQRDTITVLARVALGKRDGFGDHNVAVHVDEYPLDQCVHVRVIDLGEAAKKGTTGRRRDLGNIDALIHDAMEGIVYEDDRQLVVVSCRRHLCGMNERTPETTMDWEGRTLDALLELYTAVRAFPAAGPLIAEMTRAAAVLHTRGVLPS